MSKSLKDFKKDLPSRDSSDFVQATIDRVTALSPEEAASLVKEAGLEHLTDPARLEAILRGEADENEDHTSTIH